MASFKDYDLAQHLGELRELEYVYPGKGPTGEKLYIRSQYCDEFRQADSRASRQIASLTTANGGKPIEQDMFNHIELGIFASLVAAWTFDEECNTANVVEFLSKNPHVKDEINKLAANDSLFFGEQDKK